MASRRVNLMIDLNGILTTLTGGLIGVCGTYIATRKSLDHATHESDRQRVRDKRDESMERFYLAVHEMAERMDPMSHRKITTDTQKDLGDAAALLRIWFPETASVITHADAIMSTLWVMAEDGVGRDDETFADRDQRSGKFHKLVTDYDTAMRAELGA